MSEPCMRVTELLAGHPAAPLDEPLAAHARSCEVCRTQLELHAQLRELHRWPLPQLSTGFAQRVARMAAAQEHAAPLSWRGRALEAAYALLGVTLLFAMLRGHEFGAPRISLPAEWLLGLAPAGFAIALATPAMIRSLRRAIATLLA